MTSRQQLSELPCDANHPYPAPDANAWFDSLEYGAAERRPGTTYLDYDPAPIFRAVAAALWDTSCSSDHVAEIAADPILTTHAIAVCVVAGTPFGPADVIKTLLERGLKDARSQVEEAAVSDRKLALFQCLNTLNSGFTVLRIDLVPRFPRGRR